MESEFINLAKWKRKINSTLMRIRHKFFPAEYSSIPTGS